MQLNKKLISICLILQMLILITVPTLSNAEDTSENEEIKLGETRARN